MKKEKPAQDIGKNEHFLYIPPLTNNANDETEGKEEHLQLFFFHPQNKTTENLNLRIEEDKFEDMEKKLNDIFQHFGFDDGKHI